MIEKQNILSGAVGGEGWGWGRYSGRYWEGNCFPGPEIVVILFKFRHAVIKSKSIPNNSRLPPGVM